MLYPRNQFNTHTYAVKHYDSILNASKLNKEHGCLDVKIKLNILTIQDWFLKENNTDTIRLTAFYYKKYFIRNTDKL